MKRKKKTYIKCFWCGYKTDKASAIVEHMFVSGHGLLRSMRDGAIETGLLWELERQFALSIQDGTTE